MIPDKKKYQNIVNDVIRESFPELKDKKISIYLYNGKKYNAGVYWPLPFLEIIFINKNIKLSNSEIKGLLVHELCHFERDIGRGWLISLFLANIYYWSNPSFRRKEERETDKLVIKKGYAR